MATGANTHLLRKLNSSAILDLIREHSPIAPSEISRRLKISMPTVLRISEQLQAEGLICSSGDREASGGRPRSLLSFNEQAFAVIGLDLGGTKLYGTIADLGGHIQEEIYLTWKDSPYPNSLEAVYDLIERLLRAPRPPGQQVRGIGVGAPGVTDSRRGLVTWAPSLDWRDLPLKKLLEERFKLPALVENDVNLAALGEVGFGAGRGASSVVGINIGTGIGAGIVLDRKIYRGHHFAAGEIGYLPTQVSQLGRVYDGFGALESLASGSGVETRARALRQQLNLNFNGSDLSAEQVFQAARQGQSWAQQIVAETVDYLALGIAAVIAVLDPEIIILGGGMARSADLLIEPIQARLTGVTPYLPRLVASTLGSRAAVMGAILLVLDATTEHISVRSIH